MTAGFAAGAGSATVIHHLADDRDEIILEALFTRIMGLPERSAARARLEERARLIRHGMLA